jgi:hypothetical protein
MHTQMLGSLCLLLVGASYLAELGHCLLLYGLCVGVLWFSAGSMCRHLRPFASYMTLTARILSATRYWESEPLCTIMVIGGLRARCDVRMQRLDPT